MVHGGVAAVMEPPTGPVGIPGRGARRTGMWTLDSVAAALGPAYAADRAPSVGFLCEDTLELATETIGFGKRG